MHRLKKPTLLQRLTPYLILVFALVSGALSIQPLSNFIQERLRSFQSEVIKLLQDSTGLTVRYKQLNPSILLQADLTGLELARSDGTVFLTANKVAIGYNIFDFIIGRPLKALNSVNIVNAEINFDQSKDAKLFGWEDPGSADQKNSDFRQILDRLGDALLPGVVFKFENTRIHALLPQNEIDLTVSGAELVASTENLNLSVVVDLRSQDIVKEFSSGFLQGRLRIDSTYFRKSRDIQAKVGFDRLRTPWGTFAAQNFAMFLSENKILLRKIEDQQAFDLGVTYNLTENSLDLSLQADAWKPGLVFTPSVPVSDVLKVVLESSFKAQAEISYNFNTGLSDYSFNINGKGRYEPFGDISLVAQGKGKNRGLSLDSASFDAPGISARYNGELSIGEVLQDLRSGDVRGTGYFSFVGNRPLLPFPVSVSGNLSGNPQSLNVTNLQGNVAGYPISSDQVQLSNQAGIIRADLQAKVPGTGPGNLGTILFSAQAGLGLGERVNLSLGLASVDARSLSASVEKVLGIGEDNRNPQSWDFLPDGSEVNASLELDWKPGDETGTMAVLSRDLSFDLGNLSIKSPSETEPLIKLRASLKNGQLVISDAKISSSQVKLGLTGTATFDNEEKMHATIAVSSSLLGSYEIQAVVDSQGSFQIQGGSGLYVEGIATGTSIGGFAKVEALPLPALGPGASISGSADYTVSSLEDWQVTLRNIGIDGINYNPANPRRVAKLSIARADIDASGLISDSVVLVDSFSAFRGKLNVGFDARNFDKLSWLLSLDASPLTAIPLTERESIRSNGSISATNLSLSVDLGNSPIIRFVDAGLRGGFSAHIDLNGPIGNPVLSGSIALQRAFLNKDQINLSSQFGYKGGVFSLSNTSGQVWDNKIVVTDFELDPSKGQLSAHAALNQIRTPRPQATNISLSASWPAKPGTGFDGLNGRLFIERLPGLDGTPSNYDVAVSGSDSSLYFTESVNKALLGYIRQDGSFAMQVRAPFPFQASAQGKFSQGRIDANVTDISVQLWPVTKPFLNSYFTLFEGSLSGSVRLVGDINDPDFYGSLKASKVKSHLQLTPDPIEADSAFLVFEEKQVRLLPFTAKAGKVPVKIEAEFALNRWLPQSYTVQVDIRDNAGLHVSSDFGNIGVDGYAYGKVAVSIANDTIDIRGQVTVDQASLWMAPTTTSQNGDSGGNDIRFVVNLEFTTGKAVEFVWPLRDFPIFRSNLELGQVASFNLNQNAGTYKFTGNVSARGGELTSLKRNFFIREANIAFNEDNVKGFDPIVNARAELRTFGEDGRPVKVYAILENTHLNNMVPRFESDPPMSLSKISSVLTGDIGNGDTGVVSNPLDIINETGQAAISQLSQFRSLESLIKSTFGMAQFSMRTNLIGQLASDLVSTLIPLGSESPLDSNTISLGKYIDNTTMVAGWYLGTDVYIEAMLQLKSDASALADPNSVLGLKPYFELNMEWNTPFFLLNWNFAPKDVRRLLLDNTLTFTWRL